MAYRDPSFYFYNGGRDAVSVETIPSEVSNLKFPFFDSRLGEVYTFETDLTAAASKFVIIERQPGAVSDAIDTIFVVGGNFPGNSLRCSGWPTTVGVDETFLGPTLTVDTPIVDPIEYTLNTSVTGFDFIALKLLGDVGPVDFLPEFTEVFFTTKRTMTRGPNPHWEHPWQRSQRRFTSDAGVASTWLTGPARKRYTLTWSHLFGADRQIMLDMREQTDDWSQPFFFTPPDTIYPTVFVELDRNSDWMQDHDSPLDTGTSDEVTLPLIEALG